MNSIQITSFERDTKDSHGKDQPIVYHGYVGGRAKVLTKRELLAAIELTLPEGQPQQPASTLPYDYESANGH